MRFADDTVVYSAPRRRVLDYGYTIDDAELARVEHAARNISNQTIDEADYLRAISRRNDNLAIDRANRLMEAAAQPLPTAHLRAHYPTKASDLHALEQAHRLSHLGHRSMSMSDLSEPSRVVVVPAYPHYYPHYYPHHPHYYHHHPEVRYLPPVPHHHPHYAHVARPTNHAEPPISDYRRRLERRLDTELLNFEFPSADSFNSLKDHLRGVNDKLLAHRLLLDRYAGIEMAPLDSVEHSVESKCSEILARMPNRSHKRSSDDDISTSRPIPTPHVSQAPVSRIRHRIKKLVDRSKERPYNYY